MIINIQKSLKTYYCTIISLQMKIPKNIEYQLTDKEDNYGQKYILVTSNQLPWFMLEAKDDDEVQLKIKGYLPIYLKQLLISNFNEKLKLK